MIITDVRRHLLSSDKSNQAKFVGKRYLLESDICYQIEKATFVIKSIFISNDYRYF